MRRNTRKRSKTTGGKAIAAAAALTLGAGGLVAVNVYASAHETSGGNTVKQSPQGATGQAAVSEASTIDCPDVGSRLQQVPDQARAEVDRELAALDSQVSEAYQRLQSSTRAIQQDNSFASNAIIVPLEDKRAATIDRISTAIGRAGTEPQGLEALAACTLRASGNQSDTGGNENGQEQGQENGQGQEQDNGQGQPANGSQAGNGPVAADFVDITSVKPNVTAPRGSQQASRGPSPPSAV